MSQNFKPRFRRHQWSSSDLKVLETFYYKISKFPSLKQREDMAREMNCSGRKVQVWFQNKRQRENKTHIPLQNIFHAQYEHSTQIAIPSQSAFDVQLQTQIAIPLQTTVCDIPPGDLKENIWMLLDSVPDAELLSYEHSSSISQLLGVSELVVMSELIMYLCK